MEKFDVFLCHNTNDKPAVIQVAEQLKQCGIVPWLDIWHLPPGFPWQPILEQQIDQIGAAAVFVGGSGIGPWQSQEIDAFLREFVKRKCRVIPVLLPDAPTEPKLPPFLQGLTWVDFRLVYPEPMGQLTWGITGQKPQGNLQVNDKKPEAVTTEKFLENTKSLPKPIRWNDQKRQELLKIVHKVFEEEELKTICLNNQELLHGNPYSKIQGNTVSSRLNYLVDYLIRKNSIQSFLEILSKESEYFASLLEDV
ncbi:EAD6 domain-containing conflict system protein [Nodularia spumigena]|uniref:EAD6 domain-containing conflict system protein n=1 Tax=Nodularia spumigena UHCC 0060 TaxID=3110300 RepID=A0ABU5UMF8_NODSP|nr:EAD6 domain-containing conflict system protein [Nodularia spumigena]MEA5523413.1 EAD6 domain-containing conflict system protein [Nodularia spumigena UHCC 0143]MEA5557792.1 EAD6 domain-containing conflict system protein [Nodularia spumigena CH309]MEA5607409.1 EAD6 domain-containing conflict system protein [Nodularia spumigena UHCC 0060]MEA5614334.1 EAD6 domain-containing conflict system protein [Nodularia spumigena UHCC 0040]